MLQLARHSGDAHPVSIRAVVTTRGKALRAATPGDTIPGSARQRAYLLLMTGKFKVDAPVPPGARLPTGRYLAVTVNPSTFQVMDLGLSNHIPRDRSADSHDRVRTDRLDANGTVTLRYGGRLYHIGAGRTHARTHVLLLAQDLHIRVINAASGELLRELTPGPTRSYQPTGRPPGPPPGTPRRRKSPEP